MKRFTTVLISLLVVPGVVAQTPLTDIFTYQGRLDDNGSPANGIYDIRVNFYRAASGGASIDFECVNDVNVVDGLFTVTLDPESNVLNGNRVYLEISIRPDPGQSQNCQGIGGFTQLAGRQELTISPHAGYALKAPWSGLTGVPAGLDGHSLDAADGSPADALFVDNDGNVGIGTSAPTSKLQVQGGGLNVYDDAAAGVYFTTHMLLLSASNEDPAYRFDGAASTHTFYTFGGPKLTIAADGKVGIGTTTPNAKLHVGGTAGVDGIRFPDGTLQTTAAGNSLWTADADDIYNSNLGNTGIGTRFPDFKLHLDNGTNANLAGGGYLVIGPTTSPHLAFDTTDVMARRGDGTASTLNLNRGGGSVLLFPNDDSGVSRVGIGRSAPESLLHISSEDGIDLIVDADTNNAGGEDQNARLVLRQDGGQVTAKLGYRSGENVLEIMNDYPADMILGTGGHDQMIIKNAGQVFIGADIDDPTSFRLKVEDPTSDGAIYGYSEDWYGVSGGSGSQIGVHGLTFSGLAAVKGEVFDFSETGTSYGVWGTTTSVNGLAGYFENTGGGVALKTRVNDIGLPASALSNEDVVVEDDDAVIGIYSSETGSRGSAISLGEITGGDLVDKWTMVRNTSGSGGQLIFKYGTDPNYSNNTTMLLIEPGGDVGIGTSSPDARLEVAGDIKCTVLEITGGADLSEGFAISAGDGAAAGDRASADTPIAPGMVVVIDPQRPGQLKLSEHAYDAKVAGVISGAGGVSPGMVMGQRGTAADGKHPVALTGRVYCWCDASDGAIQPGDLLTTSGTPGHAMKATDREQRDGAVIGKAMTALESGRGLVLVLVNLQ
ncbi:MAG: hypothetical protein CHACPFDD_03543 [Phycisphaerae bacterium]|nr:hypothetical protein [Phycisphaerae bacterium]